MSRINTNVPALVAQNTLARSNADLQTSLQRLSTGLQINRGADNPAASTASRGYATRNSFHILNLHFKPRAELLSETVQVLVNGSPSPICRFGSVSRRLGYLYCF